MLFRPLFDHDSSTHTYLIADETSGEAALIDPVDGQVDRDVQVLAELGLTLNYTLETHVHADHVTGADRLRARLGSATVVGRLAGVVCADVLAGDGDVLALGDLTIEVRETPGHTAGCVSYYLPQAAAVFTGDALLIRGCGRTDFQEGDAETLYRSVHERLFSLPDATRVYPGHDYRGRLVSTIGEEKVHNLRLGGGRGLASFVSLMTNLDLAQPKQIDVAVPANQRCGRWAPVERTVDGVPEVDLSWLATDPSGIRVVDVREDDEYVGPLGHIEGSELVPLSTVAQAAQGWDRAGRIVTVCRSGGRSGEAARLLESMGFLHVASAAGGMTGWGAAGHAVAR